MICKHVVKVFEMLHLDIEGGVIVREVGTLHSVEKMVPMSQTWMKGRTEFSRKTLDNVIDLEDCPSNFGSIGNQIKIDLKDSEDMFSQICIHEAYLGPTRQYTYSFA